MTLHVVEADRLPTHDECAAGKCSHAASERVPCRCPECDPETKAWVERSRFEGAMRRAGMQSQITPRFLQRTFDTFIQSEENYAGYKAALAVAERPSRGLGLYGSVGVGKSHLAAAIANECREKGVAAVFVGVDELLNGIRQTFDPKAVGSEHELVRSYATIPVLVLDDFGKEALSDWTVRTLFTIVNRRYEMNLPLVITSNFSPMALAGRKVAKDAEPMTYASMFDRMREMTGEWVEILGSSRR